MKVKKVVSNYRSVSSNRIVSLLSGLLLILFIPSCTQEASMNMKNIMDDSQINVFNEEVKLIRSQVLSNSELCMLIKDRGVPFNLTLLNPPSNSKNYINSLEMASNIGVYVADLNYLFVYEEDQARAAYLDAIFYLAEQLDVESAFDKRKFDVLLSNGLLTVGEKIEFLDLLVKEAENKINTDERAQLVALIVSGSWIEGVFINFSLAKDKWKNEVIAQELLNHLESYDRIKKILTHFKDYQPCADRLEQMEKVSPMVDILLSGDVIEINDNLDDIASSLVELRMETIVSHNQ